MLYGHNDERRVFNREVIKFNHPEIVTDDYRYRGAVKNHKYLRHDDREKSQICLESTGVKPGETSRCSLSS